MSQAGLVLLSMVTAALLLWAVLLAPSFFYLRVVDSLVGRGNAPSQRGAGCRVWLEATPLLGLFWRFRNVSMLDAWLADRAAADEAVERMLKARLGRRSSIARLLSLAAALAGTTHALRLRTTGMSVLVRLVCWVALALLSGGLLALAILSP